ncbi:MAG: hypothetical protein WC816_05135 [Sphingomonas sp.]|jgi:hypothetical protein
MMNRQKKTLRTAQALTAALGLAGCSGVIPPPAAAPTSAPPRIPVPYVSTGLERVIGKDANSLIALFGKPDADITEGTARKLQFQSQICVLDAYLYPKGGRTPVVSYVDARQTDGSPIDRASCVAALTRRSGGK